MSQDLSYRNKRIATFLSRLPRKIILKITVLEQKYVWNFEDEY